MTEFDANTVRAFVDDSLDQLSGLGEDLLQIEASGRDADPELVNQAFRAVHSVKGGAGFMGLDRITQLAHAMESVLNLVRNEGLTLTSANTSDLLRSADCLTEMLRDSASSNTCDIAEYVTALEHISVDEPVILPEPEPGIEPDPEIAVDLAPAATPVPLTTTRKQASAALETLDYIFLLQYLPADLDGRDEEEIRTELEAVGGEILETIHHGDGLSLLYATAIDPEVIGALAELADEQITQLLPEDLAQQVIGTAAHPPAPAPSEPIQSPASTPEGLIARLDDPDQDLDPDWWLEEDGAEDTQAPEPVATAVSAPSTKPAPVSAPAPAPAPPEPRTPAAPGPVASDSLRVHVGLLDDLMNLAGELVLTRNQLIAEVAVSDVRAVESTTQRLDLVTTELQEAIVSTRMQPVGSVFGKFRRIVRDLSQELGKEVELHIEGEDVELDKTIVEGLSDPLTHLVRNAMDHGIETTDTREQLGKSVPAKLFLRARHEAGHVLVEIADDGAGIDAQRIRSKAESTGIMERSQLESMSERDIVRLIFRAGFSMAEQVTDLSGRGVGMDVVHTNLTRLGGVVDIDTEVGAGTTIGISLPLTLAIIPSLLVNLAELNFAIPQANIDELVRIPRGQRAQRIESIGEARVLRLRHQLLPLIFLRSVLGIGGEEEAAAHDGATHVAVLRSGGSCFGLVVDELLDSREIVVKPLDKFVRDCAIYAGGTILGDGAVALILDVAGVSKRLIPYEGEISAVDHVDDVEVLSDSHSLLLVHLAPGEQFALPLGQVKRIEAIRRDQIEVSGGRPCMQYRGGHLILFSLSQAANTEPVPKLDELFVVVFRVADREVGLLVSEVLDIASEVLEIEDKGFRQPGISGSTIVRGETTLMIDLYDLVRHVDPDWISRLEEQLKGDATVLLAEDTPFFHDQMSRCLQDAGYQLVPTRDGAEALEVLQQRHEEIDLVVSDVEMPRLDGLSLARAIRRDKRLSHLPAICVSSLNGDQDRQRGLDAGFSEYLIKLNKEELLATVRRLLDEGTDR
jgi:two-component system, chemotaxis family, sensor kinase CheA